MTAPALDLRNGPPSQDLEILVVDDERQYLSDFSALFSRKFHIVTANSGQEALEALRTDDHIAVIVSDQRMPGMTGSQFLGEVAHRYPHTVRMLLTGYSEIDAIIEAVNKGGVFKILTKDQPLREIEAAMAAALEKYSAALH